MAGLRGMGSRPLAFAQFPDNNADKFARENSH